MKNQIVIKLFILILIFVFTGCGDDKKGPTQADDPIIADPNPPTLPVLESISFPIMTWFGIPQKYLDREHFQDLADAGFTINFSHLGTETLNMQALQFGLQTGVKLIVNDNRIQPDKPVDEAALKSVDAVVERYKSHGALFGYHIRDEPSAAIFSNMAAIKNRILSKDPNHLVYANLFPDYASSGALGTTYYHEHVQQFMQTFKPQILSYDHYPFTSSGFRRTYYKNLEAIRAAALDGSVSFWAFTMSCAIDPAYPEPQESWIRLQVFSDLAYGAKGIQYFTYGLPVSNTENFTIAILDGDGNKTYIYYIAKEVNSEIHALAPTLKQLQSLIVYHSIPLPNGTLELADDFIIKETNGLPMVMGYFKDTQNRNYLMLVNRDYDNNGYVDITFADTVTSLVEVSKTNGTEQPPLEPDNSVITLQFEAGDGRLFRIESS